MNKRILYVLPILVFIVFSACQKINQNIDPDNPDDRVTSMLDLDIPDGFNWETSTIYEFNLSGGTFGETLKITSADGNKTYHKSTYKDISGNYRVDLDLPNYIQYVQINGDLVSLSSPTIHHNLTSKSGPPITYKLTNYALVFDGVDDYVNLGDVTELNGASTFTIEGWANQASNTDAEVIFSKYSDANNDISVYTGTGTFYIDLGNGSDSYATWATYSATITSGTWFHWAVVYDGSGGTNADRLKLYINGNTTPITLTFTGTIPVTTSASLSSVDAFLSDASSPFGGYMDEVRVWSDVRTPVEINENYNKLISASSAGLVAYWRMDEGTGTTTYDETSSDYDATMVGAIWAQYLNSFDSDGDTVSDYNDDYPFDDSRAYDNFQPTSDTGTIVFEDLWPAFGDFDFNDLVIGYQFKTVTNATNTVMEIFAYFEVRAHGAGYLNGFGFELPDAAPGIISNVEVSGYSHSQGIITIDGTTRLESGQTNPVVIVMDNVNDFMGQFENTILNLPSVAYAPINIEIDIIGGGPFTAADFSLATWNPFIFVNQVRSHEIHMLDYPPTDKMDMSLFNTYDDASNVGIGDYYRSSTKLPWAMSFPITFDYPVELKDITTAYLHFQEWAESSGAQKTDWYSSTAPGYRNNANIY